MKRGDAASESAHLEADATPNDRVRSSFSWNAGGWFGAQFGCTLWLLILSLVLSRTDAVSALVCFASFVSLNAWGAYLWRARARLGAYAGVQRLLLAASVLIALVVLVLNARGVSVPPGPGTLVSTHVPYWMIGVAPALMLAFMVRERLYRQGRE